MIDNSFDTHRANCKMCVDNLHEVKKLYAEGKTKGEIKLTINITIRMIPNSRG